MSLEIEKMLVLSTSHITGEAALTRAITYPKSEYGWFVYVPGDLNLRGDGHPKCLHDCMNFALKHDCHWIMFDCDGLTVEELPSYDW